MDQAEKQLSRIEFVNLTRKMINTLSGSPVCSQAFACFGFGVLAAMVSSGELRPDREMLDAIWAAETLDEVLDRIAEFRKAHKKGGN